MVRRLLVAFALCAILVSPAAVVGAQRARIKLTVEPAMGCGSEPVVCVNLIATVSAYKPPETAGDFALYDRKTRNGEDRLFNTYVAQFWTQADGSTVIQISNVPCAPTLFPYFLGPWFKFGTLSPSVLESNLVKAC